jgi:sulfate/thiosulfate transport system permease protein
MSVRATTRTRTGRRAILAACLIYVALLLLFPLGGILYTALKPGLHILGDTFSQRDVRHAFALTAVTTLISVVVTTLFGLVVAWVLVRQRFFGRGLLNALVDLPFALSPVTVGLAAVILFGAGGWLKPFFDARGVQVIFALPSIVLVTIFICIPFVIREVVPVLQEVGVTEEEAARTLGASSMQTFFRVTLKNIRWGLLYGIALTTARSIGEIGAVLIVSGQLTGQTETATLYVLRAFDQFQDDQGYIVALTLALVSIVLLVLIEVFKRRQERTQRT